MSDFERTTDTLLYVQVSDYVREKFYSREWGLDSRIPSEHELMEMLDLSRGTVQKSIRALVHEGLLVQHRGRGTFVRQPIMARPSSPHLVSFAESMKEQGIPFETEVIECHTAPASKVVAWGLDIQPGDEYLYLTRVRRVFGAPVMFIESNVDLGVCPGLAEVSFDEEGLFAAAERVGDCRISKLETACSARTAGWRRAKWLECDEKAPVLSLEQTVRLDTGEVFEWGSVWLPANRCIIYSETERKGCNWMR